MLCQCRRQDRCRCKTRRAVRSQRCCTSCRWKTRSTFCQRRRRDRCICMNRRAVRPRRRCTSYCWRTRSMLDQSQSLGHRKRKTRLRVQSLLRCTSYCWRTRTLGQRQSQGRRRCKTDYKTCNFVPWHSVKPRLLLPMISWGNGTQGTAPQSRCYSQKSRKSGPR